MASGKPKHKGYWRTLFLASRLQSQQSEDRGRGLRSWRRASPSLGRQGSGMERRRTGGGGIKLTSSLGRFLLAPRPTLHVGGAGAQATSRLNLGNSGLDGGRGQLRLSVSNFLTGTSRQGASSFCNAEKEPTLTNGRPKRGPMNRTDGL
jgi:hypothetical protein